MMKLNPQTINYISMLVIFSCLCYFTNAISLSEAKLSDTHLKVKRSPFLRLDELSTKIYLAKNKLGGGMIDPLEIGKRSAPSPINDDEVQFAVVLYDGISECVAHDSCSRALKLLLDN